MSNSIPLLTVSITTGTDSSVSSSFLNSTPITPPSGPANPSFQPHYIYVTPPPLTFANDADLTHYQKATSTTPLPSFPPAGGSICAVLDYPPNPTGTEGKLHRTQTLDYIFIMEGTFECSLDNGEKRIVTKGDVVVQRASMHAWRNMSATEGARIATVVLGIEGAIAGAIEFFQEKRE